MIENIFTKSTSMKSFILLPILLFSTLLAQKPDLFLLKNYNEEINVTGWYMSEKLDGVRAYWDGRQLFSRSGKIFNPPKKFTKDFPPFELDGELWTQRDDFSNISSIVNTKTGNTRWYSLTYNIFEVPNAKGNLLQRINKIQDYLSVHPNHYIRVIDQIKVKSSKHLKTFLNKIVTHKGEGVVVRNGTLPYYTGRKINALKVKKYNDAECKVTGHTQGKGKYMGLLGAILCKTDDGTIIKIGTGLSDKRRVNPPSIGSIITYKYYGLTSKGNPRFPVFLKVKYQ